MRTDLRILESIFRLQGIGKDPYDRNYLVLRKNEILNSEEFMNEILVISYPEVASLLRDNLDSKS